MKLKAKVTFEWEYKADSKDYGTNDSKEAAKIDVIGAEDDIHFFIDGCPHAPKIEIEPI